MDVLSHKNVRDRLEELGSVGTLSPVVRSQMPQELIEAVWVAAEIRTGGG